MTVAHLQQQLSVSQINEAKFVGLTLTEDKLFDPTLYQQHGEKTATTILKNKNCNYSQHRNLIKDAVIVSAMHCGNKNLPEFINDTPTCWIVKDINGQLRPVIYNDIDKKFYTDEFVDYVTKTVGLKPSNKCYLGQTPKAPASTTVKSKRTRSEDIAR